MNIVPPEVWDEIRPIFVDAFPHETAVAVFKDGTWKHLENQSDNPRHRIKLSPEDSMALLENPPLVLLHSHINTATAQPSDTDSLSQIANGYPWGITVVYGNEDSGDIYEIKDPECWGLDEHPPLEGRTYLWGVRDCVSLCHDYYKEQGYNFPLRPRIADPSKYPEGHWGADQIRYWLPKTGFKQVPRGERKVGDMVTQCWGGRGPFAHDHCLIYLGEGTFLHQMNNRHSEIWRPQQDEERFLARWDSQFWRPPAKKRKKS